MKKVRVFCIAVFLTAFTLPAAAQEGGRIHFGNLKVIPSISVQEVYDDNIFLKNGTDTPTDATNKKVTDLITHIKPGLMLEYTSEARLHMKAGYQGDWAFYRDNDGNNWKNHQGLFGLDYKAPGGLIVGVDDTYLKAEDPYGSMNNYNIGRVTKRWTNDLKSKAGYGFGDFRILGYYNLYKQEYDNIADYSQNWNDNEVGFGMQQRFLPKTWGFLRYHYGWRYYNTYFNGVNSTNTPDNKWHRVNAGLTWDPGSKLSGELNVGYQWKKYDNPTVLNADGTTTATVDKNLWIAATSINFKPTTTTTLGLNITRQVREVGGNSADYFIDTGAGLSLDQRLFTKFRLRAGVLYSKNEYQLTDRTDDNYNANIGLAYYIQEWLNLGLDYAYKKKDSNGTVANVKLNEYVDNMAMVSLNVTY